MFNKAEQGSVQHFTEIANRLEGKVGPEERETSGIKVVILDRANRPKWPVKGEEITREPLPGDKQLPPGS